MDYIYVAYEENKNWLASENGGIDELKIFGADKKEAVISYINDRLKVASDNDYVIDEEADLNKELTKDNMKITLFRSYQDNWDYSYDLVVQKKPIN
jgi:hypothetical protein